MKKFITLLMLVLVGLASTMAFSPPRQKAEKANYAFSKQVPVTVAVNIVKICGETDVSVNYEINTYITTGSKIKSIAKNTRISTDYKRWCYGIRSYNLIKLHKTITKPDDKVPPLAV